MSRRPPAGTPVMWETEAGQTGEQQLPAGRRPPLGASALWQAVMEAAEFRCHCTGSCGARHSDSQ
ncbi:hypothetical protein ABZ681_32330, partial [Streptomyces griseoflavus]